MHSTEQLQKWTAPLIAACREASAAILEIYGQDFQVDTKSDNSPLTQADLASHRVLGNALEHIAPEIPVLSEEGRDIQWEARRNWPSLWLVDPLDGTREFVNRNGDFTVNVALIEKHIAVLGLVAIPVTGEVYVGIHGQGAWKLDRAGNRHDVRTQRPARSRPVVIGSRSHSNQRTRDYFESLGDHTVMSRGSALKFCVVAEGEADLYPRLGPTSEWDTAAGHAVVEAAGGKVTRADGQPLLYNSKPEILNPEFLVIGDPAREWPTVRTTKQE